MSRYQGVYSSFIEEYISFKRSLGYQFNDAASTYYLFDQFTIEQNEVEIGITKELADKWMIKRPNESDITRYKRVMYLIQLATFLNESGYPSYMPRLPRNYKSAFTPYIFTKDEMQSIFNASDQLEANANMDSTVNVIPALLRLLYGTGIRIGEAVSLKAKDVNLEEQYLIIRHSKNGTERLVPFSDSVTTICKQYRNSVQAVYTTQDRFFIKRNGYPCASKTIYQWYRKVLWNAGIPHGGKGRGPRLHDFRYPYINKIRTFYPKIRCSKNTPGKRFG